MISSKKIIHDIILKKKNMAQAYEALSAREIMPPGLEYSVKKASVLTGRQQRDLGPQGGTVITIQP
jgi:hypothetical protein